MNEFDTITYDSLQNHSDLGLKQNIEFIQKDPVALAHQEHNPFINDGVTVIIIVTLAILGSVISLSNKYLSFIINSIFNRQTAYRLFRERIFNLVHPALRLDLIYFLTFGLFIFNFDSSIFNTNIPNTSILILVNVIAITVFVTVKQTLYFLSGFIFDALLEVKEYIFNSKTSNRVLGLFLLPFSIISYFTEGIYTQITLFLGLLIILFFSVLKLYRGLQIIAQKDFSISYLILYLCTLEILPILTVWRILSRV